MKNKFQYLVVILLLILFPLISWLYLRNGIKFRKNALDQLANKSELGDVSLDSMTIAVMKDKITLVDLQDSKESLKSIKNQFKESTDFVILSGNNEANQQLSEQELTSLQKSYPNKAYILIDNEGKVRRTYLDNNDELKQMVIHIATLIPFVEKKKPRGSK